MNRKNYLLIALGAVTLLTSSAGAMSVQELSKRGSGGLLTAGLKAHKAGNVAEAQMYADALQLKADNAYAEGKELWGHQFTKQALRLQEQIGPRAARRPAVPAKPQAVRDAQAAFRRRRAPRPAVATPTPARVGEIVGEAAAEAAGGEAPTPPPPPPGGNGAGRLGADGAGRPPAPAGGLLEAIRGGAALRPVGDRPAAAAPAPQGGLLEAIRARGGVGMAAAEAEAEARARLAPARSPEEIIASLEARAVEIRAAKGDRTWGQFAEQEPALNQELINVNARLDQLRARR